MPTILYLNAMGEISGAERSLLALLDALDRSRWTPLVAAPEGELLREVADRSVPCYHLPNLPLRRPRSLTQTWSSLRALQEGRAAVARIVHETAPQLLHANTTPAMLLTAGLSWLPIVWQVRDLAPLGWWGARLYQRAAKVVTISEAVRAALQRYAQVDGGKRLTVLSPAVDTAHFQPAANRATLRLQLGLPVEEPLIGLLAQFVPWKRHALLLDALELLVAKRWHAVLAGADFGREKAYVAALRTRLAKPPLAGRVHWLPWQSDPAPLLAALDICTLTSRAEPFGRVIIEAMSSAVPVVAVDDGGPREIINSGETGLLAPADPVSFAAALAGLLDDAPQRETFGQAARQHVLTHYTLHAHRAALNALYESLL